MIETPAQRLAHVDRVRQFLRRAAEPVEAHDADGVTRTAEAHPAGPAAHRASSRYRLVMLATRPSSRRSTVTCPIKNATVLLGYLPFSLSGGATRFHLISNLYEQTSVIITNLSFRFRVRSEAGKPQKGRGRHVTRNPAGLTLSHDLGHFAVKRSVQLIVKTNNLISFTNIYS